MNHPNTRSRRRIRALAVAFVLLYGLASVRSFVPGLCATQAALDRGESAIAPTVCCAQPPTAPDHRSPSHQPLNTKKPQCGLCHLALGLCAPSPYAADGTIARAVSARECREPSTAPTTAAPVTNLGRDPPSDRFS